MTTADFRQYLMPADSPRIGMARNVDPQTYAARMLATPGATALRAEWQQRLDEPLRGITADGIVQEGLFPLLDEGFEVKAAMDAAFALLETLTEAQRSHVHYPIDAKQWRAWYNPEIPFNDFGVRLEDTSEASKDAFMQMLRACTSDKGFSKVQQLMIANLFLGELYDVTNIMNEWSFHLLMFGTPSTTEPWGWSIYGHHVGFCCFILGRQMVISPTFMGVEPNIIDRGDGHPFSLFTEEERLGLELMQSLPADMQERATIYKLMEDPAMPPERFNFADQRHLGGAFQDNRIIPLEGVCVSEFDEAQRQKLLQTIETFIEHLPDGRRAARMKLIEHHLDETWWNWIGGCGDDDPFYYRIQSPVVMIEFDHHSGMWLTNEQPAKFHIHTITRIPNGNDYGNALLRQYQSRYTRQ